MANERLGGRDLMDPRISEQTLVTGGYDPELDEPAGVAEEEYVHSNTYSQEILAAVRDRLEGADELRLKALEGSVTGESRVLTEDELEELQVESEEALTYPEDSGRARSNFWG